MWANLDILFQGTGNSPPSVDYMYGVAALNCWGTETSSHTAGDVLRITLQTPPTPNPQSSHDSEGSDCDDGEDPGASQQRYSSTRRGTEMARAINKLNGVIMSLKGISPQEAAKREEKRMEQQQRIAQRASQSKVMEWMRTVEYSGS
jgi:hypothetical protein